MKLDELNKPQADALIKACEKAIPQMDLVTKQLPTIVRNETQSSIELNIKNGKSVIGKVKAYGDNPKQIAETLLGLSNALINEHKRIQLELGVEQ